MAAIFILLIIIVCLFLSGARTQMVILITGLGGWMFLSSCFVCLFVHQFVHMSLFICIFCVSGTVLGIQGQMRRAEYLL